ncbi:uncharacterized protein N7482_006324 [Penicillium canariense]|uniref:Uncharacterized protein n=1 Tax=Penicillium canariense TaxID=189055 RepID=A0A9W9LPB0_9EURO|nr:uncharacterized protein N7482_006324 [Penicillium canariense]KAJ5167543.1 hypothetical protein N7482_006324 [Penicillium canariense]
MAFPFETALHPPPGTAPPSPAKVLRGAARAAPSRSGHYPMRCALPCREEKEEEEEEEDDDER